jgi:hypothetical protein
LFLMSLSLVSGLSYKNLSQLSGLSSNGLSNGIGSDGGTFSPASISGLLLWHDASDTASITQSAGAVSQWNDKSGNNYHSTQGTGANQPLTNSRTINSKNVIAFDGVDDFLNCSSSLYSVTTGDNTILIVFAKDDARALARPVQGSNGANRYGVYGDTGLVGVGFINSPNGTQPIDVWATTTTPHAFVGYRNGTTLYTNMVTGASSSTTNTNATSFTLTALTVGNSASFFGVIAEIVIYNSALSTTDINRVGNYYASKWGITWTDI